MTFQMNIEHIIEDDGITVSEKLQKLDILLSKYKEKIEQIKKDLIKDFRYCYKCKDYYKKNAWEIGVRSVTRTKCKNPLAGGYLDDYEYEQVTEEETYYECPKGHKIVDNYGC